MKAPSIVAAALAAVAVAGCTVHQTEEPILTGPSDLALSMSVTASPQSISQNGAAQSTVTVKVYYTDPSTLKTAPKADVWIRFDMVIGGVPQDFGWLWPRSVKTNSNGEAKTTYTAPPSVPGAQSGTCQGVPGTCVTIVATPTDTTGTTPGSFDTTKSASATILLMPPGVILPPAGTPLAAFTFLPTTGAVVNSPVSFDASTSCVTDSSGGCSATETIASYAWDFGDGGSGTGVRTTHAFGSPSTFVVTLTVTSDRGLSASTSKSVTVGLPTAPTANFVFSPSAPVVGDTVRFDGSTSTAAAGHRIVSYTWRFVDDGTTASGVSVTHVYSAKGTFPVILTVVDDTGQQATKETGVTVN